MGFYSFVLLTATVVLACVNCSSKATTATSPVQETTERPDRRSTTRFPRTSDSTGEDDEARQSLSNEVKSAVRTLKTRVRVQKWMLDWRMNDKAILKKLNIGDDVKLYLEGPNAELLYEVARAYRKRINNNSKSQIPLLMKLLTLHKGNEVALRSTLYAASQSEAKFTKKAASMLLKLQYKEWQKDEKTVAEIVTAMRNKRKGRDVSEIFADSNLKVLEGFIQFSGRVKDSRAALVDALVIGFGGKRKFLDALMSMETLKHQKLGTIKGLEHVVLEVWRKKELRPVDVIKKELDMMKIDDLASPAMQAVFHFADNFNHENDQNPFSLIQMFTDLYGSISVTNILIKAKENGLEDYAAQLMMEQTTLWVKHRKPVSEVIDLLNIGGDGYEHLKKFKFRILEAYSKAYQEATSTFPPDIFGLLRDAFKNEEECFMAIAKAMNSWKRSVDSETSQLRQIPKRLEWLVDALYDGFEQRIPNLTPEDVKTKFSNFEGADKADVELIVDEYTKWRELDEVVIFTKPRRA